MCFGLHPREKRTEMVNRKEIVVHDENFRPHVSSGHLPEIIDDWFWGRDFHLLLAPSD